MPALGRDSDSFALEECLLNGSYYYTFQQLVQDVRDLLGPSSGIDSINVDPNELQGLMRRYISNPVEWIRYAQRDPSRSYTRNLVDRGNGKANLLILVWSPGQASPIHDHADAHCVMKVLGGCLKETLYSHPDQELIRRGVASPPTIKKETILPKNEVAYITDSIGIHRVSNPDPDNYAVSLHLYTPPYAAVDGCNIYDEKTGKPSHIFQGKFYSEWDHRL